MNVIRTSTEAHTSSGMSATGVNISSCWMCNVGAIACKRASHSALKLDNTRTCRWGAAAARVGRLVSVVRVGSVWFIVIRDLAIGSQLLGLPERTRCSPPGGTRRPRVDSARAGPRAETRPPGSRRPPADTLLVRVDLEDRRGG